MRGDRGRGGKGESPPRLKKGHFWSGCDFPIKVSTDQRLYMVSFERNRDKRCFDPEIFGPIALVSPSFGRLFSSYWQSGAARDCKPSCWSLAATVSVGCRRRLPDTSTRRQSVGRRTATRSDLLNWPPMRHRASDTQHATRATHVEFIGALSVGRPCGPILTPRFSLSEKTL
jgi:hypothetical protein